MRSTIPDSIFPNDLIVIGGVSNYADPSVLASTEIYQNGVWMPGPDFSTPIYGTTIVQYSSDTIIVVGGATSLGGMVSNKIYSLSKSSLSEFVFLGVTIQSRFAHVSILVPKSFADCQNNPPADIVDLEDDDEDIS